MGTQQRPAPPGGTEPVCPVGALGNTGRTSDALTEAVRLRLPAAGAEAACPPPAARTGSGTDRAGAAKPPQGGDSLVFAPVTGETRLAEIFELRFEEFGRRNGYLIRADGHGHPTADAFEATSFHFCCSSADQVVAACRYTPPTDGRWEASELCPLPRAIVDSPEPWLQISRVVVRHEYRQLAVTEVLLAMACRWLLRHTEFREYFALCRPALARHYRHFGADVMEGEDVIVPSRSRARYRFVRGRLDRSNAVIADYLAGRPDPSWALPTHTPPTAAGTRAPAAAAGDSLTVTPRPGPSPA